MTVRKAIAEAESILPGRKSPEGRKDPRWQAIIEIGMFIPTEPEAVWNFVERWGHHRNEDLRTAIATCLLEHLLEHHFLTFFDRIKARARQNRQFADTFSHCWKLGQSREVQNADHFDELAKECNRARKRPKARM
jgi:hypothetical protein